MELPYAPDVRNSDAVKRELHQRSAPSLRRRDKVRTAGAEFRCLPVE